MPATVKNKIAAEISRTLTLPELRQLLLSQGVSPHVIGPADFDAFIWVEVERLGKVDKASGMRAN